MTAKIIQLRDFQNPKDLARMYSELTLEQQAVNVLASALGSMGHENAILDTAPCEMNPYVAPGDDCA